MFYYTRKIYFVKYNFIKFYLPVFYLYLKVFMIRFIYKALRQSFLKNSMRSHRKHMLFDYLAAFCLM